MPAQDREQIGTVTITRRRIYPLDPWTPVPIFSVVVEPGVYPLYQAGDSRYWRMTGFLNRLIMPVGDGTIISEGGDDPGDDDVVVYSRRYGPAEWEDMTGAFTAQTGMVFTVTAVKDRRDAATAVLHGHGITVQDPGAVPLEKLEVIAAALSRSCSPPAPQSAP